jgi:hypothetical protein
MTSGVRAPVRPEVALVVLPVLVWAIQGWGHENPLRGGGYAPRGSREPFEGRGVSPKEALALGANMR